MFYCLCVAAGLFFYSGTVNAMEVQQNNQIVSFSGYIAEKLYGCLPQSFSFAGQHKDDIKKYPAQGITHIVVNGNNGGPRIKLNIKQITDENVLEEAVINADKNILSSVLLNRDGNTLNIGLCQLDYKADADIEISVALKNYTKIVAFDGVDITFTSSIRAKTIELLARGMSSFNTKEKVFIQAEDLIFIDKEDLATIMLAVETKLLQAQSRGNGDMTLQGNATKQQLLLHEGSYHAFALDSQTITVAKGVGKEGNQVELSAQELIDGFTLLNSNYVTQFNVPYMYTVQISPIEEDVWADKFVKNL